MTRTRKRPAFRMIDSDYEENRHREIEVSALKDSIETAVRRLHSRLEVSEAEARCTLRVVRGKGIRIVVQRLKDGESASEMVLR